MAKIFKKGTGRRPAKWLLTRFVDWEHRDVIIGDLEEGWHALQEENGNAIATLWYYGQVMQSLPAFLFSSLKWQINMFRNYLKISIRNLLRDKGYSLINISGLTLGTACCILMFLFVQHELSFDRFHEASDRIYRVIRESGGKQSAVTAFMLAPTMRTDFPDLKVVRFRKDRAPSLVKKEEKKFFENRMFWVDADMQKVFSFPQISGDPNTMLQAPYTVVLTASTARKYFGTTDVLGENLTLRWNEMDRELRVTGVLEDVPSNAHFQFDMLVSFATAEATWPKEILENWDFAYAQTYVLLPEDRHPAAYEAMFPDFVGRHLNEEKKEDYKSTLASLQPLTSIHLHSKIGGEVEANGEILYVYFAAILGFLVLLVACINYMNLSTARAARRAKEVGVRKVTGANRQQIIFQFLSESFLFAGIALLLALLLTKSMLPFFNQLVNKKLAFSLDGNYALLGILVLVFLLSGLVSGSYPAFYLSAFKPVTVLKGALSIRNARFPVRQLLVVTQFTISIMLIIGTIAIYKQLDFVKQKRLGYNKEQVLIIPQGRRVRENPERIKQAFLQHPDVLEVSISSHIPTTHLSIEVASKPEGGHPDGTNDTWPIKAVSVDPEFFESFGMKFSEGRNFSKAYPTDSLGAFILNQAAVKALAWEAPLGKQFAATFRTGSASQPVETREGQIIGVVEDAHFESLHTEIEPTVFFIKPFWYFYIAVKFRPTNPEPMLAFLEKQWSSVVPGDYPFEYTFLDEYFAQLYETEEAWGKGLAAMAAMAIFVACLGLLGLVSFLAEQRTKEIGIRKVLGSSNFAIMHLLSQEFIKLVIVANLIAWPLAYLLVHRWLENFAYRTGLPWWVFLLAGLLTFGFAVFSVSFQAVRASQIKPADALRWE